jgi:nitrate reductase NapAB chaperone NapD
MPIKSYLVHTTASEKSDLARLLSQTNGCEVNPSTNADLLILVTDTASLEEEKHLEEKLKNMTQIKNIALVSGFDV